MSQIYKITLKPIGSFYFGGEQSFSSMPLKSILKEQGSRQPKETLDYFKPRQGYFAKSEKFPQQTQLFGMIRKELLIANGLLLHFKNFTLVPREFQEDALKLVGGQRWDKNITDTGAIESLSPMFLENATSLYAPAPKDMGLKLIKGCGGYVNGEPKGTYALQKCNGKHFNAKDYMCSDYIDHLGNRVSLDDLFVSHTRTHTQTFSYKADDDEQLFKVKRYTLDSAYSFVCYLTMNSDEHLEDGYTTTVNLGGEESHFRMSVKKVDTLPNIDAIYKHKKSNYCRIVLLSDSYIKEIKTFNKNIDVMFAGKKILRTIDYEKKTRKRVKKSQKTVLLEKGSIIYPKEGQLATIKDILSSCTPFTTIGYNQFQIIQGEENE